MICMRLVDDDDNNAKSNNKNIHIHPLSDISHVVEGKTAMLKTTTTTTTMDVPEGSQGRKSDSPGVGLTVLSDSNGLLRCGKICKRN